jgi:hypothetical protein
MDVVPDSDWTNQLCAGSEIDIVAEDGGPMIVDMSQSDDHAVPNPAISADFRISANYNPSEMVDNEARTDLRFARQLNPGEDLDKLECNFVEGRADLAEGRKSQRVSPAPKTIDEHDPEALSAQSGVVRPKVVAHGRKKRSVFCLYFHRELFPCGRITHSGFDR